MPLQQARSQRRHEQILDAALDVFSRKGYHDAAVDDVAIAATTSKGGIYFHFPNKQTLFLALLDRMAALLRTRIEAAVSAEPDPVAKADIALQVVLQTFASHRTLSRLFFVEALGAGSEFNERMAAIRGSFAALIQQHLDEAVCQGSIPPIDTAVAGRVWFGALNEVVTAWVLGDPRARLEDAYPTVRALLLRSIGAQVPAVAGVGSLSTVSTATIRRLATSPGAGWSFEREEPRLRRLLEEGLRLARDRDRPVAVSAVFQGPAVDPLAFFARGAGLAPERRARGSPSTQAVTTSFSARVFWSRPRTGYAMAGVGSAQTLAVDGARGFHDATAATATLWQDLLTDALVDAPADTIGVGPLLMGGFAFDPSRPGSGLWRDFPSSRFLFPRHLLTVVDGVTWLTLNAIISPQSNLGDELGRFSRTLPRLLEGDTPSWSESGAFPQVEDVMPAEEWKAIVAGGRDAIRRGDMEKVVFARACRVRGQESFDPAAMLNRLRAEYPSCFVFAVAAGERCFLGATPERLARLRDGMVSTMCLAGSSPRGVSEAEDRELGDRLLASAKDRAEHAFVVRGLRSALADVCEAVAPVSTPVLLKVRNVQHLLTTVVGRIRDGRSLLDVVNSLHPTPAVGGYPSDPALRLIREQEQLDRGWYAGPIGWLDQHGEGEFAVAIRSGLLHNSEATLFAGCGIVADSDPDAEYVESRLKLRAMLSALRVNEC